MPKPHNKRSWKVLYYTLKFQFLGLKWCFALNAEFSRAFP